MENNQNLCYITYAVPKEMLSSLGLPPQKPQEEAPREPILFPPGFVPEWYLKGCYPEDDID